MHRSLLGLEKGQRLLFGDHIDRNRLNNQKANLRILTPAQNNENRSSDSTRFSSKEKNVHHLKDRGKWRVDIQKNGKKVFYEEYNTEEEAVMNARQQRLIHHPYAR